MSEKHLIGAELEIEVRDKNGRLLEHRRQESKSFVKQFIDMLYGLFKANYLSSTILNITATDGTGYPFPNLSNLSRGVMYVEFGANDDRGGIVVGTSDEAVEYDDYNLKAKISHGSGSGQLSYGATVVEEPYKDGTEYKFRVFRTFTNNSGASITVKEVGLVAYWELMTTHLALLIRDVLASPTSIPDGASLTVRYYIKVSVP